MDKLCGLWLSIRETLPPNFMMGFMMVDCLVFIGVIGSLNIFVFLGMGYSTLLLVGLSKNHCDWMLFWFVGYDWLLWFCACLGCYDFGIVVMMGLL